MNPIPLKFVDPERTLDGTPRARVALERLRTLWFNTGTLCNLECAHCYIESSPRNDALLYLRLADAVRYLDELTATNLGTEEIGFTGGEPFMNPELLQMLEAALARGYRALVLTNAMRPMQKCAEGLLALQQRYGDALTLRVSLDHPDAARHDTERGRGTFSKTIAGLRWLAEQGFRFAIAGRREFGGDEQALRLGYARVLAQHGIALDRDDTQQLVLFPEMDSSAVVPEISTACWGILGKSATELMCASQRMVVHRRGEPGPRVVACTLLPYDTRFEFGASLASSRGQVVLNHPHCAAFCVLGGGSCSA